MKHNFDSVYSQPTPTAYTAEILRDLDYQLPFVGIQRLLPLLDKLSANGAAPLNITVLGSSYGLEATVLKSGLAAEQLIARWLDETQVQQAFPETPQYQINFVDIETKPLQYAQSVGLCERYFVEDISKPYSAELEQVINAESDVITGIGIAYYISAAGFEYLIKTAFIEGQVQLFCLSVPNYQNAELFSQICLDLGLSVQVLGEPFAQRRYASAEERNNIQERLRQKGKLTALDADHITTNLYLITRAV